jgi:hypothetical protein
MPGSTMVNVTLNDEGLADFERVAERLAERGLKIVHKSPFLGVISGEIVASLRSGLESVKGVDSVGDDHEMVTMDQ